MQTKTKRELNVKRILCIGGSLAAVVILVILMAGTSSRKATDISEEIPGDGMDGAHSQILLYTSLE